MNHVLFPSRVFAWLWNCAGGMLFLLGLPVILGLQMRSGPGSQAFSAWKLMQFNTALGFFFMGFGLLSLGFNKRKQAQVSGFSIFALGSMTSMQYVFGINIGIDQFLRKGYSAVYGDFMGRMGPNTAISFILVGITIVLLARKSRSTRVMFIAGLASQFPVGFGLITILSHCLNLSTTYGWGNYALMGLPTAMGFVFAGALLLSYVIKESKGPERGFFQALPLFLTLVLFSLAIALWQFFLMEDANKLKRITEIQNEDLKLGIAEVLGHQVFSMKRMATRLEYLGTENKGFLGLDSKSYLDHLVGLTRIGLVDKRYNVTWSYPKEISAQVFEFNQGSELRRKAAFDFALSHRQPVLSQSVRLKSGGMGFLLVVPLFSKGKSMGFVYATINAQSFFRKVVSLADYQVNIYEGDSVIYTSKMDGARVESKWAKKTRLELGLNALDVESIPTMEHLRKHQSLVPDIVLIAGIMLSLLVGLLLQLFLSQKQVEAERQELLTRLKLALSAAKMGIWSLNLKSMAIWLSDNHDELFGYGESAEEWDRDAFMEHVLLEDRARVAQELQAALKSESSTIECRIRRVDDHSIRWILIQSKAFYDLEKKPTHILGIIKDITAQKNNEEERLAFSELRRAIVDGACYAIISTNVNGVIQTFNKAAEKMLGYRADEVVGKSTPCILHDPKEIARRAVKLTKELKRPIEPGFDVLVARARLMYINDENEWTYVRKDGTRLPALLSLTALRDAENEITGYLGIAIDLTEKKKVEEEKNRLLSIIEESPDFIGMADMEGNFIYQNRAASRMVGLPEGRDIARLKVSDMHPPWASALVLEKGLPAVLEKGSWQSDNALLHRDGREIPVSQMLMLHRNADGAPAFLSTVMRDVSERKRAEKELGETTKKLKLLIDSSPVGILVLDRKLKLTIWNPACERLFGWSESEALGRFLPFVPPDKVEESLAFIERIHHSKGPVYFQGDRVRKNGLSIKTDTAAVPLFDEAGEVDGLIAIMSDITEKDQLQQKIIETNNELKAAIGKALEEQEKAIAASNVKSEFLANMSHEIRTPINGVLGMAGLLLDTRLKTAQKDYAENIKRSAESLLAVVNDILDFSKVEAGKLDLEEIEFDLGQMMSDTIKALSFSAKQKKLRLRFEGLKKWPRYFIGDPGRIRQVLTNLISNSIKFTPQGDICIRLIEQNSDGQYKYFKFEVEDHGIGIPRQAMGRMFQAFSQADSSTARRFGGTGLGLSICKRLVQLMGGHIDVMSEEGKGSTFWFLLGLKEGSLISNSRKRSKMAAVPKLSKKALQARILVAEDNAINQKVVIAYLDKLGLRADAVANGSEVLTALANIPYDLILMDCQMPEIDGYEATRLIRQSKTMPFTDVPVVAMTANAVSGDKERCLAAGMNDYVTKPVDLKELALALERCLTAKIPPAPVASIAELKPSFKPDADVEAEGAIDWSFLDDLGQLDPDSNQGLVQELSQMFISGVPERIDALRSFLESKNHESVKKEAHSLKSSGGNLGAVRFARLCEELEGLQQWDPPAQASQLIEKIQKEFLAVKEALSERMPKAA